MTTSPVCVAPKMYALTGGPSSGKTSIIDALEKRGEPVVREAATDWITSQIRAGVSQPWKEKSFTWDILQLQLEREKSCASENNRTFIDRGVFDVYAFAMRQRLAGTETLAQINKALNPIDLNQRYKAIFFVLPHSENFSSLQTEIRQSNTQEAAKLEVAAYALYCRHGHFIEVPGGMSPDERANFILEKINEIEKTEPSAPPV